MALLDVDLGGTFTIPFVAVAWLASLAIVLASNFLKVDFGWVGLIAFLIFIVGSFVVALMFIAAIFDR